MKVLVIGGGNMGLTYANGMANANFLGESDLMIMDASIDKVNELKELQRFQVYDRLEDCFSQADVVFIVVKPYHSDALFQTIKKWVRPEQIFVSLMAGVTIATIQSGLGSQRVIRTMPNLPAQVGKGVTSYTGSSAISESEYQEIHQLLATTGIALRVNDEKEIDATTGISGSGPAYVFYFIQAMIDAAEKMGFPPAIARDIVTQTFDGAIDLFKNDEITAQEWMNRVASKGGTTEAALQSLDQQNVNQSIQKAAFAAFNRAQELGK